MRRTQGEKMVGMGHAGDEAFLAVALISLGAALFSIITGKVFVRSQGTVIRSQNPRFYWEGISVRVAVGAVCLCLYFFT